MSSAFVKESEEQRLNEVGPSVEALIIHLTRENNGIRVYQKGMNIHPKKKIEVYSMSNGLEYAKDEEGKWFLI